MSFLADVLVVVLTAYLAFTNSLAVVVTEWLPAESVESEAVEEAPPVAETAQEEDEAVEAPLPALSSRYERGGAIPDILIKNAAYQRAAVITATASGTDEAAADVAPPTDPTAALVNVLCTYDYDDYRYTRTGSGFFIDERGVILTNAHVAQFLLLDNLPENGESSCIVRMGDPAEPRYRADILYISPAWILEHAALIDDEAPSGTGERDYALLLVTEAIDSPLLPATFPALSVDIADLPRSTAGDVVTIHGYPAERRFENDGGNAALRASAASTTVSELFTFGSERADVFSLAGSALGERGASGGPVVAGDGEVIGMIATKGDDATDGAGSLRAITLAHINRTITEETSFPLAELLTGDLAFRARIFNETLVPFLSETLVRELGR